MINDTRSLVSFRLCEIIKGLNLLSCENWDLIEIKRDILQQ